MSNVAIRFGVLVLCALAVTAAFAASPSSSSSELESAGTTAIDVDDLSLVEDAVDETHRTRVVPRGASSPPEPRGFGDRAPTDPAWGLLHEIDVSHRVTVGGRFAVRLDVSAQELSPLEPADPLTTLARQAVDRAPSWLAKQLEDNLARMGAAQQDEWAQKVLDAVDPHVDEVAFLIAHISPQDLGWGSFDAQLVDDSSTYAYEVDPDLDYVELRDVGSAAEGGDYWTTLVYDVELDGTVSSVEYPREIYYWYIVHPRGSDERPTYIDPVPCSSSGQPAAPPTGKFWQRWLYYETENKFGGLCDVNRDGTVDEPCPVLKDALASVPVLWRHNEQGKTGPANGAVGVVNDWVRQSLGRFGDRDGCRPVQPVTVYYHNDGNCGEWADLTMAAGRAALIPTEVTGTRVNDHVWNEFYDHQWSRWVQWEPVNNMVDGNYAGWWGSRLAAAHTYRGDGWGTTERTSQHGPSATLTVTVFDANHYPVDGATVYLGSEWDPVPIVVMEASLAHTDASGQVAFTIGDARNYYVFVETPWGRHPSNGWSLVVENAQPDTGYDWSPPDFSGAVPRLQVSPASSSGTLDDHLLEVSYSIEEGYVHGESFADSIRYSKAHPGDLDVFVADQNEWDAYESGEPFEAFELAVNSPGDEISFVPPEAGDWYVAWSNGASIDMNHVVRGTVTLYENTGAVPAVRALDVEEGAARASLLDWEDVVGQNVDGYDVYRSTNPADVGAERTETELQPYLLAHVDVSHYEDPDVNAAGTCYFYSVRTVSRRGGISP